MILACLIGICAVGASAQYLMLDSADKVLDFAKDHLPKEPMQIEGSLIVKAANNFPKNKYAVKFLLEWNENRATYWVSEAASGLNQKVIVKFPESGEPSYEFFSGADLKSAEMPDPLSRIGETDLSWADLSLSFFWWPNAKLTDYTRKLGQSAYEIEIPAPYGTEQDLSKIKTWISMKQGMMLGAEMFDKAGKRQRYLKVDSIKKVEDGFWMIKDLDVKQPGRDERTKLEVDTIELIR